MILDSRNSNIDIYKEEELTEEATAEIFSVVQKEGKRFIEQEETVIKEINLTGEKMGKYDTSDDIEFSQRLLDKYHMIGNIKELHNKLRSIPDSYEGFVAGVLRYASTSCYRKEKVMYYLEQNPHATCSQVTEYVMKQFDFHDAAKQTELEAKLYKVKDSYSGFARTVLNYVSRKTGRTQMVLEYLEKNVDAQTSDILEFISNQEDFYEDEEFR